MKINIHSKPHDEYLDFVVDGLRLWKRSNKTIEKIDVFNESISVTYYDNPEKITELLNVHEHITDSGLDPFISISDMKNGNSIRYDLKE